MGRFLIHTLFLTVILSSISFSEQVQSSQTQTLLGIQQLLNFPYILSSWDNSTDFCNTEPSPSVTLICYQETLTQLHLIGDSTTLSHNLSIDSFVTTLVKLPNLKVLTLVMLGLQGPLPGKIGHLGSLEIINISSNFLSGSIPDEIGSLLNLQTLILDHNMFTGRFPNWLSSLPNLSVLSLKNNSLAGSLPKSLTSLVNLRVLDLSHNLLVGEVPPLRSLFNLQILDLEYNKLGVTFPEIGKKLVTLVLRKNRFESPIPGDLESCYDLQHLDISLNRFVGPFPTTLLSLPAMNYLSIRGNRFTGLLTESLSCNSELKYVDLSSNLLSGRLPNCLDSKKEAVLYAGNCISGGNQTQQQHPLSSCLNAAFAVDIFPPNGKASKGGSKRVIALSAIGGILGGIVILGLVLMVVKVNGDRRRGKAKSLPARLIMDFASNGYSLKMLTDARYVSQTMKMEAIGLPAYRSFTLEELEEATNNFDIMSLMGEGFHGQMYRGKLKKGSLIAIKCLKRKKTQATGSGFMQYIELLAKLRHHHLVSALGHCFEDSLDETASDVFFVFEFIPNGTLRSWVSGGHGRERLTWPQRIAAATGVAKGIQFLHSGIVPGVFSNNLRITDVLLDQNLVPKICSYNLPVLTEIFGKVSHLNSSGGSKGHTVNVRIGKEDKMDIYDFGRILLEIIVGRPIDSREEVAALKDQIHAAKGDAAALRCFIADMAIQTGSSDKSLKTMMEICIRCLVKEAEERPSIDDVLWNLQFAAQMQDSWRGDLVPQTAEASPISSPNLDLIVAGN